MKRDNLEDDTMDESDIQRAYTYPIYPRDSKVYSNKVFVNFDLGSMGGSHCIIFYIKNNKSYYFDSCGGQPDTFLPKQVPKPISYHKYKIQDINSNLWESHCLYFFYLNERMYYYYSIFKMYFSKLSMPIIVIGEISNNSESKIDTSLFVQKPNLRTNFLEAIIEKDVDMKNQ